MDISVYDQSEQNKQVFERQSRIYNSMPTFAKFQDSCPKSNSPRANRLQEETPFTCSTKVTCKQGQFPINKGMGSEGRVIKVYFVIEYFEGFVFLFYWE